MNLPEKLTTARKEHTCECCGKPIKIGERYFLGEYRSGRYLEDDTQIGIAYFRYRVHGYDCCDSDPSLEHVNDVGGIDWPLLDF